MLLMEEMHVITDISVIVLDALSGILDYPSLIITMTIHQSSYFFKNLSLIRDDVCFLDVWAESLFSLRFVSRTAC